MAGLAVTMNVPANDIEFSGERKRVRCNELLASHALRQLVVWPEFNDEEQRPREERLK